MFSLRIVTTDHYISSPLPGLDVQYSDQRGSEVKRVPVFRVYGSTPSGQKTCMHIHGVFPYLYVPYDGTAPWDRYLRQFATSLDKAINVAQGQGQSNQQHVYKIVLVAGMSMYGYHEKDQQFLKIYMYNPQLIRKAADLLLGGAVLNKPFQPHESHIPYTLQLFMDYNLYGMNLINVAAVKFRRRLENDNEKLRKHKREPSPINPSSDEGMGSDPKTSSSMSGLLSRTSSLTPTVKFWDYENIPSDMLLDGDIERQSVCELEVDVVAADVLNRLEVNSNVGANPGLAALWEDERQRRRERGEPVDNIAPPQSQERVGIEVADSEQILRERLKQIIQDLQPYMDTQSDTEMDISQEDIMPSAQASQLDLHLSQDDIGGSQDTLTFDLEDNEEEAVINEASVKHVVSMSESFCELKPDLQNVTSQDRSLVDILAALAEDTDDPLSQQAIAEAVALEEHDSMLAQTTKPRDVEMDKLEEEEILEMSQKIWDGEDRDVKTTNNEFNIEGMDDSWNESQFEVKPGTSKDIIGEDSEIESDNDILPQFDGPGDEKSTRREVKEMVTKRLGMRGPGYNIGQRDIGMIDDNTNHFGQFSSPMGNYGGYPTQQQQSSMSMGSIHQRQYPIMSGQQNPNWPGGPVYSQHQTQGMMQQSQRDPGMLQHSPGRIHQTPNPMHHQAVRMRHQPGSMHHAVGPMNHSPSAIHQMPTGESSIHPSHGMSPSAANPFNDQPMSMYPSGDHAGFGHQGDPRMKDKDTYGQQMTSYGNKVMMSSMGQSGYVGNYQNSKQTFMQMEHSAHPNNQSNHALAQQNQMSHHNQSIYQQRPDFPSQMMHSQQSSPMNQPFSNPSQSNHPYGNQYQMPGHLGSNFDSMNMQGVGQQGIMRQEPGSMKISGMPVSQSQSSFDSMGFKHSVRQQSGSVFPGGFQEKPVLSQKSTGSQSPRSTNQSPASDISNKVNPQPTASYILKRPQAKGPNPGDIIPRKGPSPTDVGFSDVHIYSSCDQQLPLQVEKRLNQSPVMTGYLPSSSHGHSVNAYHLNKPVCQNQTSAANYETVLAQGSAQSSRALLNSSSMNMPGDPLRSAAGGQSSVFPERSPQPSVNVNTPVTGADLFTQKKYSYEQISPPSTPSLEKCQSVTITKSTPLSPVASQPKFDSQLSPLQKLLLEPSADRSSSKTSSMQRSHSRNSVSSVSSVSSEKACSNQNLPAAHQSDNLNCDTKNSFSNMSSPASKSRAESLSDSRLYNLLASDSDTKRKGENRTPNISNSSKLNDSQQDLFSDSLLSPSLSGSGHAHDSNIGNDSLASLFNDSYDGELNPQSQRNMQQFGNKSSVNLPQSIENRSMSGNRVELSKADSLSTLESFVGSVTSDTDYGINFSKGGSVGSSIPQDNSSLMSAVSDQSFLSQLSSNDLSDLGSFTGQFSAYQAPQTMQHHNSNSYNVANWPEHPQFHNKSSTKRFDGGPPRKRGRPPKNSLSSPGMSVAAAAPGEKKRRGRPRKNSTTGSNAQQNATSPSQNVQKQFSSFQDMSGFLGANSSQQFQQSPLHQQQQQHQHQQQQQQHQQQQQQHQQQQQQQSQEQQKLQYQSNQNFYHQTIPQHENTMNVHSNSNSVGSYNSGLTFMQNQSFPSLNQPINDFNQFVNTESQSQQQFMHQQNQLVQQPQQNYGQSFMSENMSNQGPFLSQGSSNMSTIDASQLFQEEPQQQTQQLLNLDSFGETTKTQEESQKTLTEVSNQEQDFRLTTLQSMKLPNTLVQNNAMHKHTMSEMWYTPLRRPFPSPAYTYKFRLPKQFCKKLKVSEPNGSILEVVRMHPKDARKYSLLKIGRETVKLTKLSLEKIERIKAEILKGVFVESIPPPIRNVQTENFEGYLPSSIQHPIRNVERESFQSTLVGSIQPPIKNVQNESFKDPLVGSTQPPIRNVQNEIFQGHLVGSIQPPNCNIQRENTTSHNSIIADLLTCDKPRQGNVIESALVDSAIQNSIQGLHVEKTTVMTVQHMTKTLTTNSELKLEPNVYLGNSPLMKHQRRISEGKERKRNMFKNKNIANIPHLKKYRAGFSYFGKGHVGRGGLHVKVRQSHPVLGPEFEDDSNIVLKDVSLNDGVLTPIKSRTPMAGRSPAHSSGHSMSELESQDKEELDSKLKSLYDLELQQSQNSQQMFNEEEMFVGEDEENSEDDYDSSENGSDEPDGCRNQETTSSLSDKENGQKQSKIHFENKENLYKESVQINPKVSNDNKPITNVDVESIMTKEIKTPTDTLPENCIVKNTKEFKGGKDFNPEGSSMVSELKKTIAAEMKTCTESIKPENISNNSKKLKDEGSTCGSLNEEKVKSASQIANDENEFQNSEVNVSEDESNQNVTFYGKFKSHFKEKFAQLNNTEKTDGSDKECRLNSDNLKLLQSDPENHPITRSRSSSCDSRDRDVASLCGSRRSSTARSVESVLLSSESSSVISSSKQSVDNEKKVIRTKRKSKSISSDSRKSSRSSSDETDLKKKSRSAKCCKRKPYNIDLDSDGVPGVDYIVTGKFKGYKEMKVKVKRIEIQSSKDIVNVNEFAKKVDLERNGFHLNDHESHISDSKHTVKEKEAKSSLGFSAEFEKFILSQSKVSMNEKETMIDTDINERQSKDENEELCINPKMDGNEVNDVPQPKDNTQNVEQCANTESKYPVKDSENETEKIEDKDTLPEDKKNEAEKIESTKQNQIGESQFKSSSCPCVNACVCSVKVDNNLPLISTAGLKDFSSTSEDENDMTDKSFKQKKQVSTVQKFSDVRRKKRSSHRLANAFCGPRGRKKRPQKKRPLKWMSTLDALHDATMENLTANKVYDSADISDHSPVKGKDSPETGSQEPTIILGPDFEVYCDRAVDYDDNYSDTLFRLAYYSPPSSENGNNSSPQPLSPEEMKQISADNENVKSDKLVEHREQKLTLADIMKSVRNSDDSGVGKESDGCDSVNVQQNKVDSDVDDQSATEHEIKTAIAKEAPMTLKDIKSYCLEEEQHRKKMELSSPPDLGPPVIHKFFTEEEPCEDINLPPNLTPNRQLSNDLESPCIHEFSLPNLQEQYDDRSRNHQPPFLTPCRSPRIPLSPKGSPRVPAVSETPKPESRGYFSLPVNTETDCKVKPGKSPGANSSTGSINVIHSEQFSDISEDENDDLDTSPVIDTQNQKPFDMDVNICGDEKSRDITEFGEISDMNRNNIFDYLSRPNGVFTDSEDPRKGLRKECITKEQFVRNVELVMTKEPCMMKDSTKINGITESVTYRHSGYNVKQSHSISNESDDILSLKQSQLVDKDRRGPFDNNSIRNDFWKESFDSLSQKEIMKRYDHSFNHSNNPLNGLFDLNKTHFSEKLNSFQRPQNVSIHSDKDIKTRMDSHSMDLFDSSSDKSSRNGSLNSRSQPMYSRSLSEPSKSDYSIVPSMKLNNSIIKSVENHVNIRVRSRPNSRCHSMEKDSQTYLEDKGGNKNQSKRQSHAHKSQSTSSPSISTQNNSSNEQPEASSVEGRDHDKGDLLSNDLSDSTNGCSVITPLIPPPSRGNIQQSYSHFGLAAIQSTGPFYSNHRDVPCKPREGGGQVLKVPSTLVKDLEDFNHASSSVGLKEWRTIFCVNDNNMFMSQSDSNFNIVEQLEKQPQLKYALTGDRPVVVCPFDAPPSSKEVRKWCKGRKQYKDLKNQALQKERHVGDKQSETDSNDKVSGKSEDELSKVSLIEEEGSVEEAEKGKKLRLNLFTGKRELCTNTESSQSSTSQTSQVEHVRDVQGPSLNADAEYPTDMPKLDMEMDISMTGSPKLDTQTASPVTGSQRLEEDGFLHSTPLLRRESTELFEPECTPIAEERKPMDAAENDSNQFVTPKRIKSLRYRRSSTNSDKSLRQTYMNTQLKRQFVTPQSVQNDISQIEGPSLKNSFGFKLSQPNLQTAKSLHEFQHLTVLSVEVHAESRGDLKPDPEIDAIQAIFYSLFNDVPPEQGPRYQTGVFILDPASANQNEDNKSSPTNKNQGVSGTSSIEGLKKTLLQKSAVSDLQVQYFTSELEMLEHLKDFIIEWDPDILVGYEIQMLSLGYILHRASALSFNLTQAISRVPGFKQSSRHSAEKDEWGADHHSEIHIAGRIVLNLWRILRHEVTLSIYSFENVAFHVLHRRIPLYSFKALTSWFNHKTYHHRWKTIEHYVTRVKGILDVMDKLDIIGRTSEFARVFGIEFYQVLSRGSQYRVESMMLRVAKPLNYIPVSPSVHQRARMKAPECIALTLEPESRFYTDPVVVLDFQSLYPSIMIAYNYCFSTCLGRLEWFQNAHEGPIEFGCTSLNLSATNIKSLEEDVTISPNGVVFCKQSVKRGVLPMMVEEILNTRLMVKKAMSSYKDDKTLSRLLHARQLGLKLIANVTYGYTAANFSGRMPCIEVGDSVVRKARETLERSIKLVEETPKWGAKVIYGDTDSLFLLFKGQTKDEAFKIGHEIAKTVTKMFPNPIKLKFEKVYLPCVLQTKKRYCGFMYETPDQKDPVFDAKGIETVRRDSCSAASKMLERSIKILFTSKDVSQVKSYVQQQCKKVMEGTVSLQDYIFAKEYRGIPGYKPGACVPALEISKKRLRHDRRSEPRTGERVPYVIVYGSPGLPLIQLVKQPMEVLQDYSLRLNSVYYITKQILPPLHRFLSLLGVDVFSWYHDMPHTAGRVATQFGGGGAGNKKGTISQYFATSNCPLCEEMTKLPVCGKCLRDPQLVCLTLNDKIRYWERVQAHLDQICKTCTGSQDIVTGKACVSLDCPILYRQSRAGADMDKVTSYRTILDKVFKT